MRDGLARVRPEYGDPPQPPPSRPSVPPADDVVRALRRLNNAIELELALLRVQQAVQQLRAVAEPWRSAG
jgi:hypothetical protein